MPHTARGRTLMLTIAGGIILAVLGLVVIVGAIVFWPITLIILVAIVVMIALHLK